MTTPEKNKNAASDPEGSSPSESEKSSSPKGDSKGIEELLKKAKRKGLTSKGQQGLIDFDYPPKK